MREITKTISVLVDGKPKDFRLTKLDAFSGVSLLRLMARLPEQAKQGNGPLRCTDVEQGNSPPDPEQGDGPLRSTDVEPEDCPRRSAHHSRRPHRSGPCSFELLLTGLSDSDLRSLMTTCLQHCEVLLPAGWMPVMTRGEWSYPELEHDTAVCLRLTIEEVLWTLSGFFSAGVSASRSETPAS